MEVCTVPKDATIYGGAVERSETEGEHLAALASSELFPFQLLITFAATTLVGIWSSCFAAACNTPYSARFSPRCIPHSGRSASAPSSANRIGLRCKKLEIDPGSAHKVVARWRRGACFQLPVLELLRFAASSTGRAQLRNVAGQPGRARRAREDRKQQNGKEKEQSVWTVLFFGIRQLPIFPGRRQPSIVGVQGLNFCVRDGNRWNPLA